MSMPLDEAYFVWLYSQVGSVKLRNRSKTYWKLLRLLFQKEFTWQGIEKDGNRAQDGKDLRVQFLRETNTVVDEEGWLEMGCSFLEMMIALAWQLAFEGGGEQHERFWEMIDNLGLLDCTDAHPPDEAIVDHILNKVINRDYSPDGAGGLFPLQRTSEDQRRVELWYQANAYLLERL
jgi:hypothetical protein